MELKRVVVTGLGVLSPIGKTVDEYWKNLLSGVSGAAPITYFDTANFKTKFACELKNFNVLNYMDNKEAHKMDPCAQYAIVAAQEAITHSGLDLEKSNLDRVGVVLGTGIGGCTSNTEAIVSFAESNLVPRFNPFFIPKILGDIISGWISIKYGFRGPNYTTAAACASSGMAIADAYHLIQLGKADVILSGGSEACIVGPTVGGFNAMRALSTRNEEYATASRPYDVNRDGFVIGEGAAILVLEELEHAKARGANIFAEIRGIGLSADAYHLTAPHPEGLGGYNSMRLALEDAQLKPSDVDHINAHSTSTIPGDLSECNAIESLFGKHAEKMCINATKSMTGHLLGAAAALESVSCILSLKESIIPPTINLKERDPKINPNWNLVENKALKREINVAINNSFGFGGHNVSLLFKKFK